MLPDRMLTSSRREANTRWSSTTVKWPWPARCRTRPPTPNVQLTWRSKVNGQQSYFMLHQSRKKDLIRSWLPGSVPSVFYRLKQTGQIGRKSHFHRINGCEPQLATTVPLKSPAATWDFKQTFDFQFHRVLSDRQKTGLIVDFIKYLLSSSQT